MAETLELALLGNPELRLGGQPLARFRSVKVYALLYYLAVTRRTQPRTVLAGLFWGAVDEYYARRNLNRTLSDLTQFVGDHLTVDRQNLAFAHHQPYWLDVQVLEEALTTRPTTQTVTALAAAADRYRGDFLDGFYVQDAPEFEQWVLSERTRLRNGALYLLDTLAQYYVEQHNLPQAIDYARRILQIEPWREEAHRQLMLWLAQSGQRSAALAQYELCRQALQSELAVEPDAATVDLVERIRAGGIDKVTGWQGEGVTSDQVTNDKAMMDHPVTLSPPHLLTQSPPHNLLAQRTPFVGRTAELGDIVRLLVEEDDCRLLTLVGPGGMGKTRLALKAAEQLVALPVDKQHFTDGIFFVPLENVSDANGLVSALVSALSAENNFPHRADTPLSEQILHFLRTRAMLLVLDNFEHLVKEAEFCSTLLLAAPRLKLLVTSRETLGLQEAWFYPVLGLSIPTGLAERRPQQEECDAVRLFVQCARRTRPDFALESERSAVLRICTLVEGMPLAIELAAAWLKGMTCTQIAEEVARGLDILTARYQNIPARHRSMRAVMEHSWRLLAADEVEAIARLVVFRGRFRQEAANATTQTSLFTLATLVEKALVRVTPDGFYQLHELTRQYAEEQLPDATRLALRDAHALYYADLLGQQRPHLFTSAYRQVWTTVGGELDNIRQAWTWIIAVGSTGRTDLPVSRLLRQMAEVLTCYHLFHSLWLPGQALFDHACQILEAAGWGEESDDRNESADRRTTLLQLRINAAQFQLEMGHFRTSLQMAERVLADSRAFGLEEDLFRALMVYGHTQVRRGERNAAIPVLEEALALSERLHLPRYAAEALIGLGLIASGIGHYDDAQAYYRQALALCQTLGYRPWVARTLTNLGTTYSRQYDYRQAQPYYDQALTIAQEEGDQNIVMINTSNLGGVYRGFGQHGLSLDYYQRSLTMARALHEDRWVAANLNGLAITYLAMNELAPAEGALREALTIGQQSDSAPDVLGSIGLLGHLYARRGQMENALKALFFVEQHPATMARDHLYNQSLLTELRSELPVALLETAAAWATEQALEDVVHWLLHDQGAMPVRI